MLEPIKFLFILTGASTYLVTKYIKVGLDDPNNNSTGTSDLLKNESWNLPDRGANAIARLGHINNSQINSNYPLSIGHYSNANSRDNNGSQAIHPNGLFPLNRYHPHSKQPSANSYHIALIPSTSDQSLPNRSSAIVHNQANNAPGPDLLATATQWQQSQSKPTFEIEINEEDERDLPKRLLQISLSNDDSSYAKERVTYNIEGDGIDSANLSANKFSINSTSGEIYVLKPLDRDRPKGKPQWNLNCFAKSVRTGKVLGYADIIIYLRDLNDNAPFFEQSVYYGNVSENGTTNLEVMQVKAIDYDNENGSNNGKLTYSIEQNQIDNAGRVIFDIDPNSAIITTLVCCLDREQRDNYSVKIIATDGGGLKASAIAVITVLDINDEPPRFTKKEWYVDVDETDTEIVPTRSVPAPQSTATDSNRQHLQATILKLFVYDNDLFETNLFNFKIIDEFYSNHFVKLRDRDYLIKQAELDANYSNHFQITTNIDGSASLRILRPLDYEVAEQRFIILKVIVTDKKDDFSDRYHSDVCFVYIKVRDTNDNKPTFAQNTINVSLSENTALGTIITKFYATDADQNGHSQVLYSLDADTNRKNYFSINSEGFVRLSRPLDRETIPTHIVKVIVADTDEPPLTSTGTLIVNVEDINDNAPTLINTTLPPIRENLHPAKLGELFAFDKDDYSKGNGPPFTFYIGPEASSEIKRNFRLEIDFKGEGNAVLYSNTVFDREMQKEYFIPVVVRDSGYPSLSSTSLVTVTIGDLNDNDMKDGWKHVTVYYIDNYANLFGSDNNKSLHKPVEIGQVNVEDPDDWDLEDKMFFWSDDVIDPMFYLDTNKGAVYLNSLSKGTHHLKFSVFDRFYQHQTSSTMHVEIKELPLNAVINSGSLRIVNLNSFQFITIWDWKTRQKITSLKEKLERALKQIINCDSLELFSIVDRTQANRKVIDVRYFAKSKNRFLSSVFLNSIVQQKSDTKEFRELPLNISQIGINECMHEEQHPCESSSCFTDVIIDWTNPSNLIHANFTSFVGINLQAQAKCNCFYQNLLSKFNQKFVCDIDQTLCSSYLDMTDHCHIKDKISLFTRNYQTSVTNLNFKCVKNRALPLNSRSFKGDGWIWLDPFPLCTKNFISIQIATNEPNGIIFYHGPIGQHFSKDFILLELINGKARLLFDFGSGIEQLFIQDQDKLNDGNWHQIDVHFDTDTVQLMVDTCVQAVQSRLDTIQVDPNKCFNSTKIPLFSELLNVNAPIQVGGIADLFDSPSSAATPALSPALFKLLNPSIYHFYRLPDQSVTGFTGCIRSLVFNAHIYDLVEVHHSHNSNVGCDSTKSLCSFLNQKCHNNGFCDGNYNRIKCVCNSGHYGADCSLMAQPVMFQKRSFIHLSMILMKNFDSNHYYYNNINFYNVNGAQFNNGFITKIDFNFRTRQANAEIVRLIGNKSSQVYCIVEIVNSRITFRFNLNPIRSKSERILTIESFVVNDGKWHRVEAYRFGQSAHLTLDNGGIGKISRLVLADKQTEANMSRFAQFSMDQHQIIVGGQVHYLGIGATTISNDFSDGCLNDLQINDVYIPLSDLIGLGLNHLGDSASVKQSDTINTESGIKLAVTKFQNVKVGCNPSQKPCIGMHCVEPFYCVDEWMLAKCRCPNGYIESEDGKNCTKASELCRTNPCLCYRDNPSGSRHRNAGQINDSAKLSRLLSSSESNSEICPDCDLFKYSPDAECDGEDGEKTDQHRNPTTVNARIFKLEYGLFFIVIIALVPLNIPFIIYIVYICYRNHRLRPNNNSGNANRVTDILTKKLPQSGPAKCSSSNDDIRENIVCYRDEGGGEDDVRAYNMIPLRIQISNGILNNNNNSISNDQFENFLINQENCENSSLSNIGDTWQELTVI